MKRAAISKNSGWPLLKILNVNYMYDKSIRHIVKIHFTCNWNSNWNGYEHHSANLSTTTTQHGIYMAYGGDQG